MKTRINRYDAEARTVDVTFTHQGVKHRRGVNACLDADGEYDAAATKSRVAEVAAGVEKKIELGVIA
ncbi:MAG TPA: hypothetical protein VGD10_08145 [Allosphingosinicella sp.]|uniref:hypothetical protein n=1 Tax=Allosphingosinicella sp. TaxID=2823234 RepID=UPI002ED7DEBC